MGCEMPISQYLGKSCTRSSVSRQQVQAEEQELGDEGDKRTQWGGGLRELSPTPALPLCLPSTPSCFFQWEERQERTRGWQAASQVAGALWERSRHPASLSPADVDCPPSQDMSSVESAAVAVPLSSFPARM